MHVKVFLNRHARPSSRARCVTSSTSLIRGGSRISGKGVHMYKGLGVRFADFVSFSIKYPMIKK